VRPGASPPARSARRAQHAGIAATASPAAPRRSASPAPPRPPARGPILLVIDQLEELFTLCQDAAEQRGRRVDSPAAARDAGDPSA